MCFIGCNVESLKSPEVSSNQLRRMTFEVQQQGPLIKPVEVQPASEMLMPPPTKVFFALNICRMTKNSNVSEAFSGKT